MSWYSRRLNNLQTHLCSILFLGEKRTETLRQCAGQCSRLDGLICYLQSGMSDGIHGGGMRTEKQEVVETEKTHCGSKSFLQSPFHVIIKQQSGGVRAGTGSRGLNI